MDYTNTDSTYTDFVLKTCKHKYAPSWLQNLNQKRPWLEGRPLLGQRVLPTKAQSKRCITGWQNGNLAKGNSNMMLLPKFVFNTRFFESQADSRAKTRKRWAAEEGRRPQAATTTRETRI